MLFLVLKGGTNNERTLREKVGEIKRKEIKVKNCESEWPRKIRKEKNHRCYFQFIKLDAHSAYSSTLYTCKEINCERKDPPKLLWEGGLIFPTCTPPTFSNHCNSWLCNQSRDFFCDTTYLLSFYCSLNLPVQSQFWQTGRKMNSTGKAFTITWSFRSCTENKPAGHCSATWLSFH